MTLSKQRRRRAHRARRLFRPWLLLPHPSVGVPPSARAGAASVAGLATLAARFGRQLGMLGKAALLIGHALATFAAGNRSQLAILRETALCARYALAALAAGFRRETPILRETAFLIGHGLTAHA